MQDYTTSPETDPDTFYTCSSFADGGLCVSEGWLKVDGSRVTELGFIDGSRVLHSVAQRFVSCHFTHLSVLVLLQVRKLYLGCGIFSSGSQVCRSTD